MEEEEGAKPVELAIGVALAGMDPIEFLECTDPTKALVMFKIAQEHAKAQEIRDKNLAVEIVNALAKSFKA